MRVLLLSDINSAHTRKWVVELTKCGVETGIFSFAEPASDWFSVQDIPSFYPVRSAVSFPVFSKISYLALVPMLKKAIRSFRPDIVHAHYASSYGLIGSLCGFHPLIVSAWGSDIYYFGKIPFIGRKILSFNFKKADAVLATSNALAKEISLYTTKNIEITPFGVDTNLFIPGPKEANGPPGKIVMGTIKALERPYGIDTLIRSFALLKTKYADLHLLIVGGGVLLQELTLLARMLQCEQDISFMGAVPNDEIVACYHQIDIFVALSVSESFGVSVLEASSCGLPVVVSDAGGLPEVVRDGVTGFIVPAGDPEMAAKSIEKLVTRQSLRKEMGQNGRSFVKEKYDLKLSIARMLSVYEKVTGPRQGGRS